MDNQKAIDEFKLLILDKSKLNHNESYIRIPLGLKRALNFNAGRVIKSHLVKILIDTIPSVDFLRFLHRRKRDKVILYYNTEQLYFHLVPQELLVEIASYLDFESLSELIKSSRYLQNFFTQDIFKRMLNIVSPEMNVYRNTQKDSTREIPKRTYNYTRLHKEYLRFSKEHPFDSLVLKYDVKYDFTGLIFNMLTSNGEYLGSYLQLYILVEFFGEDMENLKPYWKNLTRDEDSKYIIGIIKSSQK